MYGWPEASLDALIDDFRLYDYGLSHGQVLIAAGIATSLYMPVTSPANLIGIEGVNNLKVNFRDCAGCSRLGLIPKSGRIDWLS